MSDPISDPTPDPAEPLSAAKRLELGLALHRRGELAPAMEHYTQVLRIDPRNGEALYYCAVVACQEGQFKEGIDLARRALAAGPPAARVHNLIGKAQERLGALTEAVKAYEAAIALEPGFAEAHGNRAGLVAQAGFPERALEGYERALNLDPTAAADWINRGALLQQVGRHEEALASYDKALKLTPAEPSFLLNRANALVMLARWAEADAVYDEAIARKPELMMAYVQKALALKYRGRFDEARAVLEKARAIEPKHQAAAAALAEILLLTGDWRAGWPLYDARAGRPQLADVTPWKGEAPGPFRLLVLSEGRLTDTVLFARYAALMAGRGFDVTLLAPPLLTPLLSTLPQVERVIGDPRALAGDQRPMRWLPLQSIMSILHLTPDTVPDQVPYLSAEPDRVAAWKEKLGDGIKVGLCWHGETGAAPLAEFAPLAEIEGVRLIALHSPAVVQASGPAPFAVECPLTETSVTPETFLDLAAIVANLDLVVGIDALPLHIAGALGRPAWLALPPIPDWRWLTERVDSPWYPQMRLWRQEAPGPFAPLFARMAAALREAAGPELAAPQD